MTSSHLSHGRHREDGLEPDDPVGMSQDVSERHLARKRLVARREFFSHLFTYVVVNGLLVGVWAATGGGYFWPAWVMGAWGVGLIMHAWDTFWKRPITDADIDRELERHRSRPSGVRSTTDSEPRSATPADGQ